MIETNILVRASNVAETYIAYCEQACLCESLYMSSGTKHWSSSSAVSYNQRYSYRQHNVCNDANLTDAVFRVPLRASLYDAILVDIFDPWPYSKIGGLCRS